MNGAKNLVLFTSSFPYGKGEQFIETEILFLSKAFAQIYIYPLNSDGNRREVPANVQVMKHRLYSPYNRIRMLLGSWKKIRAIFRYEKKFSPHREKYRQRFRHHFDYLLHRFNDAGWLRKELEQYDARSTLFYSYWFNHWATVLSLVKYSGSPIKFFTRIHGGDYDEHQKKGGYFPFRYFEMKQVDAIYPVSAFGESIIRRDFPGYRGILRVFHLGVNDNGNNPQGETKEFHIVSCSFLIPLKRVHLIIDVLSRLDFPVRWTHFGEGELQDSLLGQAKQLPENIRWEFKGLVPNADVLDFYRQERVDLFMNVSELEGIPVSVMEAISFGIPSTGCRICGVPEIVTEQTGLLLEKDFDPADAADWISRYQARTEEEKARFREGVKAFWRQRFNAEANYRAFIAEISNEAGIS